MVSFSGNVFAVFLAMLVEGDGLSVDAIVPVVALVEDMVALIDVGVGVSWLESCWH